MSFLHTKILNLVSQVPNTFQYFVQARLSHLMMQWQLMSQFSFPFSSKSATNCDVMLFSLMKLTILVTASTTWFIFNTDLHNTSWSIIQCKNVNFCAGFVSVTLPAFFSKVQHFSLSDLDNCPLSHLPIYLCEWVASSGCPFHWLHGCQLWCESLLSHIRRWVAWQCHVHCSSHPMPERNK